MFSIIPVNVFFNVIQIIHNFFNLYLRFFLFPATMYSFVYFTFLLAIFGVSTARMPPELSKMLGVGSEMEETRMSLVSPDLTANIEVL